ncbi:MAG: hypothetical protein GX096_04775 [Clostridiales bacterium]|nr:hypothetical protein [Clostridiales bacterium]
MKYTDFKVIEHGFAGHMAEPDGGFDRAVIVIMGGEKSLIQGIKIAERFAEHGIAALSVSCIAAFAPIRRHAWGHQPNREKKS